MIVTGTSLAMVRGDTERFGVRVHRGMTLTDGDRVYFTVKKHAGDEYPALIQKIVTAFVENTAVISLAPADTKELGFGKYEYDVKAFFASGDEKTLIYPAVFEVMRNVTG